jgi:tellurite resistance protein TerC
VFIGAYMVLLVLHNLPLLLSLGAVAVIIGGTIALSLLRPKPEHAPPAP